MQSTFSKVWPQFSCVKKLHRCCINAATSPDSIPNAIYSLIVHMMEAHSVSLTIPQAFRLNIVDYDYDCCTTIHTAAVYKARLSGKDKYYDCIDDIVSAHQAMGNCNNDCVMTTIPDQLKESW